MAPLTERTAAATRRRAGPGRRAGRPAGQRVPRPRPQRAGGLGRHGRRDDRGAGRGRRDHLGAHDRDHHGAAHPPRRWARWPPPARPTPGSRPRCPSSTSRVRSSPTRKGPAGVHDPALVRPLDADEVARWVQGHDLVGVVTVSPHTADAPEQIRRISSLGIGVLARAHPRQHRRSSRAAVDAGSTLATHLGNGIPSQLPRHPNALWTLLAEDRVTAGVIADGHHLPAEVLTVMLRAKGVDRFVHRLRQHRPRRPASGPVQHAGRRAGRRRRGRATVLRRHRPAGRCRRRPRARTAPPRRRSRPGLGVGPRPGHRDPSPRRRADPARPGGTADRSRSARRPRGPRAVGAGRPGPCAVEAVVAGGIPVRGPG